jgi:hypothetical protein
MNSWKVVQRRTSVFDRLSYQNNSSVNTTSVFDRLIFPTDDSARVNNSGWQFRPVKENSNWHYEEFNGESNGGHSRVNAKKTRHLFQISFLSCP